VRSCAPDTLAPRADWIGSAKRVVDGVHYDGAFLDSATAARLHLALLQETPWRAETIRMFGRTVAVPRRCAWFGDCGVGYRYSDTQHRASGWSRETAALRELLCEQLGIRFNFVLLNLYRDGLDSMGWHADDEAELGREPCIASLSLGVPRRFQLRARDGSGRRVAHDLEPGSLLVMWGDSQSTWQHALPRSTGTPGPRINLTFRRVRT
jgi:alkylated DNA repair dioxygenase AlkB